jgi:NAD(P)-dependent dehydrogenase (short-subunit alcohol dehydrogenase family)
MRDQRGGGHVFNVCGSGFDGTLIRGLGRCGDVPPYSATKAAAALFADRAASVLDSGFSAAYSDGPNNVHAGRVRLHSLNPGLVDTAAGRPLVAGVLLRLGLDPAAVAEEAATQIERAVRDGGPGGRRLNCFVRPLLRRTLRALARMITHPARCTAECPRPLAFRPALSPE